MLDVSALRRVMAMCCPGLALQENAEDPYSANVMGDPAELFSALMSCCAEAQVSPSQHCVLTKQQCDA